MSTIIKIIFGTAAIAAVSIASPAFAQYTSGKTHLTFVRHSGHVRTASHRSALSSFASLPRSIDDPATTGGGSIGYNQSLRLNRW
jgi:predicted 2-oxoglutarate/Fe(II)-dependent dioxygenase YbiX